jgi:hypothetical protein
MMNIHIWRNPQVNRGNNTVILEDNCMTYEWNQSEFYRGIP